MSRARCEAPGSLGRDAPVRRLREKLETEPGKPEIILTVRGVGYRCGLTSG